MQASKKYIFLCQSFDWLCSGQPEMFVLQLTGPEARKANNCSCARESSAATLQVKSTGPELTARGSQARNPEDRTIVLVLGSKLQAKPRLGAANQGAAQPEPEQFIVFVAASTVAARKCSQKPEYIRPSPGASTQKGPNPKARPQKPEQNPDTAARKPDSRTRKSPPRPPQGVLWLFIAFFAIFCYIYHFI